MAKTQWSKEENFYLPMYPQVVVQWSTARLGVRYKNDKWTSWILWFRCSYFIVCLLEAAMNPTRKAIQSDCLSLVC